jgi:hypothetical protein
MNYYDKKVFEEVVQWENEMLKKPALYSKVTKKIQIKINKKIPKRVHDVITSSIKGTVRTVLTGSDWLDRRNVKKGNTLFECDQLTEEKIKQFRKIATVEGITTGAGGILLGVADLPLLLSIKIKFLYDTAGCYGYDIKKLEERVFILYIFQMVFSDYQTRKNIYPIIKNWEVENRQKFIDNNSDLDWVSFQQNYRDYIDLAKMLQLIPGFGAIVGGYANYHFLKDLGETAKNCYRLRRFASE